MLATNIQGGWRFKLWNIGLTKQGEDLPTPSPFSCSAPGLPGPALIPEQVIRARARTDSAHPRHDWTPRNACSEALTLNMSELTGTLEAHKGIIGNSRWLLKSRSERWKHLTREDF